MQNTLSYKSLFGSVLGIVVDKHQWWVEDASRPTYENAVSISKNEHGELQMYPNLKGMVLKLVIDGKCTRQIQTGLNKQGSVDLDLITRGIEKLGFILNGTKAFMAFLKALQNVKVTDPVIRMADVNGKICKFQIHGGILKPGISTVTIEFGDVRITAKLEDSTLKDRIASFTKFISCSIE